MTAPFSYIVSHMKKKKLRSTITIDPLVTGRPSDVSGSVYQGNTESKRSRGKVNAHPVPITWYIPVEVCRSPNFTAAVYRFRDIPLYCCVTISFTWDLGKSYPWSNRIHWRKEYVSMVYYNILLLVWTMI